MVGTSPIAVPAVRHSRATAFMPRSSGRFIASLFPGAPALLRRELGGVGLDGRMRLIREEARPDFPGVRFTDPG